MNTDFVRSRQETGSYCGPAVVQMLASANGLTVSQEEVVEASGAKDSVMREGISLHKLADGFRKLHPDYSVWQKYNSSVEDLANMVKSGYLVAVDWQGVFVEDEYGDEYWSFKDKWKEKWNNFRKIPTLKGDQGHYCIVVEVSLKKGYIKFVDPYGHYAGKDRFIATWEFEERWWDDRIDVDVSGKKSYILEERLMFLIAPKGDILPAQMGMEEV